jgi:hypothetical protein
MKPLKNLLILLLLASCFSACKLDAVDYGHYGNPKANTPGKNGPGEPGNNGEVGSAEYYFKGKLNGAALTWAVTEDSKWSAGVSASSTLYQDTVNGAYGGSISNSEVFRVNYPAITFFFKTFHSVGFEGRQLLFENFVTTGSWAYAPTTDLTVGIKDLYVTYMDKDSITYNSIGPQTGSTFNVVSVTVVPAELGVAEKIKIKLNLNCKLYPTEGSAPPLTLTDAEAVIYLQYI